MKKYHSITHILGLACACLILIGCETGQPGAATGPAAAAAAPKNAAHVLVYRVANFGTDLALVLSGDGKDVGSFSEGRNYDGYLSPGQHTLTARVDPNRVGTPPKRQTLTAEAGETYVFTVARSGEKLAFVRGH
jgi:hypothetical protein